MLVFGLRYQEIEHFLHIFHKFLYFQKPDFFVIHVDLIFNPTHITTKKKIEDWCMWFTVNEIGSANMYKKKDRAHTLSLRSVFTEYFRDLHASL